MGKTDCKWEPAIKHRKCFISAIDDLEELGGGLGGRSKMEEIYVYI